MVWAMKRLIFFPAIFLSASVFAYDTFFFRVKIDAVQTKSIIQTAFSTKGKQVDGQPFYVTHILTQTDTNYILVQMTPQTDQEFQETKTMFGLPNVDLWRQFNITDKTIDTIVDNSKIFSVDTDWSKSGGK